MRMPPEVGSGSRISDSKTFSRDQVDFFAIFNHFGKVSLFGIKSDQIFLKIFPEAFAEEKVQQSHSGFKKILAEFCPGVSPMDMSLLNAAIMRAAEVASTQEDIARAKDTLHAMAQAVVRLS